MTAPAPGGVAVTRVRCEAIAGAPPPQRSSSPALRRGQYTCPGRDRPARKGEEVGRTCRAAGVTAPAAMVRAWAVCHHGGAPVSCGAGAPRMALPSGGRHPGAAGWSSRASSSRWPGATLLPPPAARRLRRAGGGRWGREEWRARGPCGGAAGPAPEPVLVRCCGPCRKRCARPLHWLGPRRDPAVPVPAPNPRPGPEQASPPQLQRLRGGPPSSAGAPTLQPAPDRRRCL